MRERRRKEAGEKREGINKKISKKGRKEEGERKRKKQKRPTRERQRQGDRERAYECDRGGCLQRGRHRAVLTWR